MEKKISFSEILKKYTMVLVLVLVVIMFAVNTKGVMLALCVGTYRNGKDSR